MQLTRLDCVPGQLLLATDLSARSDRAMDRAAQLAAEWRAELIVLNVLDPAAAPDQALARIGGASDEELMAAARQQLQRDTRGLPVRATLHVVRGTDAAARIVETAAANRTGLIVTGVARNEILGRFVLGSTVEQLARTLHGRCSSSATGRRAPTSALSWPPTSRSRRAARCGRWRHCSRGAN